MKTFRSAGENFLTAKQGFTFSMDISRHLLFLFVPFFRQWASLFACPLGFGLSVELVVKSGTGEVLSLT